MTLMTSWELLCCNSCCTEDSITTLVRSSFSSPLYSLASRSKFHFSFSHRRKMKLNFDDKKFVLLVQRLCIRNIGFWPGSDNIKNWQITFAIVAVIELLVFVVFQLAYCFAHIDDLAKFLQVFMQTIVQIIIALKFLVIIWKRNDFKRIIDCIVKAFDDGEYCALFI